MGLRTWGNISAETIFLEHPFATKKENGEWVGGLINIDMLSSHFDFKEDTTINDLKSSTESESLQNLFEHWRDNGLREIN